MTQIGRRDFIAGMGALGALSLADGTARADMVSPFQIGVITDEVSQDFGHACEVASKEFGMHYVELREMWGKNLFDLDDSQLKEAKDIIAKNNLKVSDIGSPLFKVDWPGAPKSKFSPKRDEFGAKFGFDQQQNVVDHSIKLAKYFDCPRVRCFDFWRLDDQKPYRAAIDQELLKTANKLGDNGLILVLENEPSCNTATGEESGRLLAAVQSPHFFLNWDPGNAQYHGETPYPDGYSHIPKNRIGHCHVKDAVKKPDGNGYQWACMGKGLIDWVGQFRALKADGYRHAASLETHWRGAGTPEESSRQSWAGMKEELTKAGILS
ncbi:MAG TPA: sugar phosphate isomerase/epimerase family protein [Candidatus Acidoferrales bacterium]|nr:sugar phosphate isomerase/epimerase family protein [Candidatus Acidoferrales bacterium]